MNNKILTILSIEIIGFFLIMEIPTSLLQRIAFIRIKFVETNPFCTYVGGRMKTKATKKYTSVSPEFNKKQAHPRVMVAAQALIHDSEHLFIAPARNLSLGGVFLEQLVQIPLGTEVKLVLRSEGFKGPIQIKGKVVRIEEAGQRGLAVEFVSLTAAAKEAIESCVFNKRMEKALKIA